MRYELKSIAVWSVMKISFFLNLILGGILGFFYALFFGLIVSVMGQSPFASQYQFDPSEMSMLPLIFFFTIGGAIGGAFFHTILVAMITGLYNLIVKMTGGVILNLQAIEPAAQATPVATATVATAPVAAPRPTVIPPPRPTQAEQPPVASQPTEPKPPEEKKDDNPETPPTW